MEVWYPRKLGLKKALKGKAWVAKDYGFCRMKEFEEGYLLTTKKE